MIDRYALTSCAPAWLNNCVGHHNHRHFFLFCVYMCIGCFYVSLSGYPLFKEHFLGVQVFCPLHYIIFSLVLLRAMMKSSVYLTVIDLMMSYLSRLLAMLITKVLQ